MSNLVQIQSKSGPQYWRSLDEMAATPEFNEWVAREFPEGASELGEGSRRTLLKLMAASFGLAGFTACRRPVENILPLSKGVEDYVHGKPLYYASALTQGGIATGVLVKCVDGRPIKVEGNPKHPASLGATSAFQQAALLNLYDPDRAKRVQRKGAGSSWAEFEKWLATLPTDGAGLRVVSERSSSPTLASVKAAFEKRFPQAAWIEYDAVTNDAAREGAAIAFGQALDAVPQYDKAEVILSLDCDFLGLDSPTPLPTKQFSARRRILDPKKDESNRLYVAEANYTLTGAMADHRLRARVSDIAQVALGLAQELGLGGVPLPGDKKFLAAAAKDLASHKGKALVVAGPRQPKEVHALVALINESLNAPVTYYKPTLNVAEQATALKQLAADLNAGQVKTLVALGGNPAYTLPADVDLKKAATVVALATEANETWALAEWQLPESVSFESWSDARTVDGTVTIMQPQIEPLYDTRSALEVASLLATGQVAKSYALVQETWKAQWRKSVHDGVVEGSGFAPAKVTADAKKVQAAAAQLKAAASGMEVAFYADASVWDGRYANNAWLQEAPDPMTKLVWDNAALLSPATAKQMGVATGDVLEIAAGGRTVRMPAMIQPGHADNSVSLALGYGRAHCGRVGQGTGHNAGPLRSSAALYVTTGATVRKTGATYELVTTQEHHTMVEPITGKTRPVVLETKLEAYREHPEHALGIHKEELFSMYPEHDYSQGYQWGMSIDLNACTGCNACLVACVAENNIPVVGKDQVRRGREMHWIRMDRYYSGSENDPTVVWQPMGCQQCQNAPCESVCPVIATAHSPEGLNEMSYNRCVGTRYCANNCPYKVRRFNFLNWHRDIEESTKMVHNPEVTVRMRGVMEKCTYCVQRIQNAKITAKAEGRRQLKDGEVVTACQQACPAEAIVFGNILDKDSRVARTKNQPRDYTLLEELNVRPRTTYLAKLRNSNPELG